MSGRMSCADDDVEVKDSLAAFGSSKVDGLRVHDGKDSLKRVW